MGLFSIILGIFSLGTVDLFFVGSVAFWTVLFTGPALAFGRRLMDMIFFSLHRHSNSSGTNLPLLALLGVLFGIVTLKIGIHALFGFFIAGLIAGESHFLKEKERVSIEQTVYSIFVPIFFIIVGLKVDKAQTGIISLLHTPSGQMHLVIGLLAFESGLISEQFFIAIVVAAVFTSIILGAPSRTFGSWKNKRGSQAASAQGLGVGIGD